MAGAAQPVAPSLRVNLAGGLAVFVAGDPSPAPLPTGKAVTLLALLLARRGRQVAIDTIVEALWGAAPPAKAEQNVASLVSRLRRVVGRDRIVAGGRGYGWPGDPDCRVDLDEAAQLLREAEDDRAAGDTALAAIAADRVLALLGRGEVLADQPPAAWVDDARRDGERLLRRARGCAWSAALALGQPERAVELALAAVADDPLDEDAHRALMLAQQLTGNPGAALVTYQRLRERLADELGTDPAAETAELHLAILRGEPATAPEERPAGSRPPDRVDLVGRRQELGALRSAWSEAATGRAGLVLVAGVTGAGKSRLVSELVALATATGGVVAAARCFEAERSLFLRPLLEAVRASIAGLPPDLVRQLASGWNGTLVELMPPLGRLFGPVDYRRAAPELEHHRSLEAIAALLERLAARQPLQLVLEDLQHASVSTLEAVHFLRRRLATARLLIAATVSRDHGAEALEALAEVGRMIELGPLSAADVAELAGRMGVADRATEVLESTGGHAAFVLETLRLLRGASGEPAAAAVPASLQTLALLRVHQVGPEAEELLRVAAMAGRTFDLDLVARLGGIDPEQAGRLAERALHAGLLVTRGTSFAFTSGLVQDVLYETTPGPVRASRHRRAAVLLEGRPEGVAGHHAAAGDWAEAASAWSAAAEQAMLAFALRDAERLFGEALGAATASGDRERVAELRLRRGEVREELADYDRARDDHAAALELARALGDPGLEARALERLGWTAYYARDTDTAADLADRAGELAEEAAAASAARPSALVLVGRLRHWNGDYDAASAAYQEALAADPDPATEATALGFLGALLEHNDRFDDARRVLAEATAACQRTGALRPLLLSMFFSGLARANLGDFGGALRTLERMRRLLEEYDLAYYRAGVDTTLAWIWREVGDGGRARDLADRALEEARSGSGMLELEQALHAQLAVADCCLLDGDQAQAAALAAAAAPLLDRRLPFHARAELRHAEIHARLEPDRAELLLALARHRQSPKYQALALARLGRREEAVRVALPTGSNLLLAEVAPLEQARAALDQVTRALPAELRTGFAGRGRLARELLARA
ncbi:MAG TPA: BTAD domain-containing putative transcriptional regulator [Actinomycetes bacterium]|nr:BTAD domain-containing putative transcriptional regulator [Actinomycetes bacterium]